jgi:integrase/recombinase XerD
MEAGASRLLFLKPMEGSRIRCVSTAPIEVHTEGTYYIEWRDRGKRCRASVTREDAVDQARRKAIELRVKREGLITSPEPEPEASPKTTIGDAIDAYLRYVRMQRKARTHLTYRYTLVLRKS